MPCLQKDKFLTPIEYKPEQFPLPEMGEGAYVCIKPLMAEDIHNLQKEHGKTVNVETNIEFCCQVVCLGVCNDEGQPIFSQEDKDSILKQLKFGLVSKLSQAVLRLSGVQMEDDKKN